MGHSRPLFINAKTGFDVEFLDYQLALMFRSQVTAMGAAFAMSSTWGSGKLVDNLRKDVMDGAMYWLAMKELAPLGLEDVVIGREITDHALEVYSKYLHEKVYPMRNRDEVAEVVLDGHMKVMPRLSCGSARRVGKPRADGTSATRLFGNGWFMAIHPGSMRVLGVIPMSNPENNQVAHES
eukprot:1132121-Amphidinium_carterae.2